MDKIKPTDEERRNGWDTESLTEYKSERDEANANNVDPHSDKRRLARRPSEQNHRYNPLRWRG